MKCYKCGRSTDYMTHVEIGGIKTVEPVCKGGCSGKYIYKDNKVLSGLYDIFKTLEEIKGLEDEEDILNKIDELSVSINKIKEGN